MKASREQAAESRERVLDVAARLFRERGFDGIGVADLMKSAGLTHGGFYGHFSSKEDLMAQATARALSDSLDRWKQAAENAPEQPLAAIARAFLSAKHRDTPGRGCAVAALGSDISRQTGPVRQSVTEGVRQLFDFLSGYMPGRSKAAKRERALVAYASMVGAIVVARTLDDAALSQELLDAVAASLPMSVAAAKAPNAEAPLRPEVETATSSTD
jgi:TetR/AcrR family transcriptional repressor of nem operon